MEWLNVTAEQGLAGLFVASFLAATLLPVGSEALLWAFLQQHPEQWWAALSLATCGNTLGGMLSWYCGRVLPRWQAWEKHRQAAWLARWGSPALLFSWLPVIGDALCVAAGWLRLRALPCLLFIGLGKGLRYGLLVWAALPH